LGLILGKLTLGQLKAWDVGTKKVMTIRLRASGCNKMSEVVFTGKVCYWQCGDFKIYYRTDTCVGVCKCVCEGVIPNIQDHMLGCGDEYSLIH